ncbi:hypothetical protein ACFPER_16285 [Agromyces aurantiacus]|uniref:Uncharacterized protein n=1 Tax=Agromyces aurantiacus TaxID=165814 RepID=A0ABV9RAS5_9MICO|nr:hypothetical protein [Agromyces aurantiacus]MBM7504749.1 hypothetical protein [Agromyces aurantiacus]
MNRPNQPPIRRGAAITGALAFAAALALLAATPANAAPGNGNRVDIGDHDGIVVATCADGGVVSGPLDGSASFHETFDREGDLVSLAIAMEYKMTWTLSTTGETLSPHGTRRLLIEFDEGTITDTGNYRKLTIAGEGAVLNYAGISIFDFATGETLYHRGPDVADSEDVEASNDLVCGLYGLDGA